MTAPKILVADDLGEEGLSLLKDAGEVTLRTGMDEDALRDALPEFDALVVRSATKVTARSLERAERLSVIGRAGIGVDNIDVPAATERGIVVMNTPNAGAVTTAELAISLLVSLCRHIPGADRTMKEGRWDKKLFTGTQLTGKTFGVVGLGNIGRVVATRGVGLGMEVLGYDPFVTQDQAPEGVRVVTLDELCAESDFVSIHVPLLDETRHLFDRERLRSMKQGARLIHAARGGIVDDEALTDLLVDGHLAGAALDVFETEPLPDTHRLRSLPNVVLSPHIGASTHEAKRNIARDMAEQIVACLRRGVVLNGVNVPRMDPATAAAVAPYLDVVRDSARLLAALRPGRIEGVRITTQGALLHRAQASLLTAAVAGALGDRCEHPITPVNAKATAEQMGVDLATDSGELKQDFQNIACIELLIDGKHYRTRATVFGHRHGRMIQLEDAMIDLIPEPPLLATVHHDQPGVLGTIGTLLGELGVNIARMQLAGTQPDGEALAIWNLENDLPHDALDKISSLAVVAHCFAVDSQLR